LGHDLLGTTVNQANRLPAAERRSRVIELRRQGLSQEKIATIVGVSHQTVRNDLRLYMSKLDAENMQAAAALRAEEFATFQRAANLVEEAVFERNDLDRIPDLVKLSEQKRKIYALDVQPVRKAEIQYKKSVVVELIHTLRSRVSPAAFAEVLTALTADEDYKLMGQVVTADSAGGDEPPRELLEGLLAPQSLGASSGGSGGTGLDD
jgi:DNA-binding CsgD family transcriptional regulator